MVLVLPLWATQAHTSFTLKHTRSFCCQCRFTGTYCCRSKAHKVLGLQCCAPHGPTAATKRPTMYYCCIWNPTWFYCCHPEAHTVLLLILSLTRSYCFQNNAHKVQLQALKSPKSLMSPKRSYRCYPGLNKVLLLPP